MVIRQKFSFIFLICTLLFQLTAMGQTQDNGKDEKLVKVNAGVDLVSRYVWRGTDFGDSPSIQPFISLTAGHFEFGSWSAVSTTNGYKELDLYAKASLADFYAVVTDYYIPWLNGLAASPDNRYFVYSDSSTAHTFEGCLGYKNTGKFPFWLQASMFFFGNDKRWGVDAEKDDAQDTYYSTYLEAGYTFKFEQTSADVYAGFTSSAGAYGNKAGFVNLGLSLMRNIQLTDKFSLPLKSSLLFNPQTSSAWFVVGITLTQ